MLVLLNGPSGVGKDTGAKGLESSLDAKHIKFADPLKRAVYALLDWPIDVTERELSDALGPDYKDVPLSRFVPNIETDATLRQLLISVSENGVKPLLGPSTFGRMLPRQMDEPGLYVASDSGFQSEAVPFIGSIPCLLVNLFREGCSFNGDSRGYWTDPRIKTIEFVNNYATVEDYQEALSRIVSTWSKEPTSYLPT